jgi:hypothetical protein
MPKKGKARDGSVVQFHTLITNNMAANIVSIPLNPSDTNLSPTRLPSEADAYAHFRVLSLKFRLHPVSRTGAQIAAFIGGVQDTLPVSFPSVGELVPSVLFGNTATTPSAWVIPSRSELAGPFPWYKTVLGTADATEEQPGYIRLFSISATDAYLLEIRGTIEFKTAVSTLNTPAALRLRADLRAERVRVEREATRNALLKQLSGGSPTPQP